MESEEQRQLNEELAKFKDTITGMVPAMVLMTAAMKEQIAASKGITGSQKDGKSVVDDWLKAQAGETQATKASTEATKKYNEAMDNLNKALYSGVASLTSFGKSLLTVGGGMSKYSGALDSAGDAALSAGKAFGPLGMAVGGVVKLFTSLAGAVLKQNDNMLKGTDSLAQMGIVGDITTNKFKDMGVQAGYGVARLEELSGVYKQLGSDITGLGATAADGAKSFNKIIAADEEVLQQYSRLGVTQNQLNKNQADYIKLQVASGQQITERGKADGSVRKASLEYTDNLLQLAAISGENIEDIKKQQAVNRAQLDVGTRLALMQDKEEALRAKAIATGDKEYTLQANRIEQERKNTEKLQDIASGMGMSAKEMAGFNSMLATGNFNELSAGFAAGTPGILEFIKSVKEGKKSPEELRLFMAEATATVRKTMGEAIIQNKEIGENVAYSSGLLKNEAKYRGMSTEQYQKSIEADKAALEEQKKNGKDAAKDARAQQETTERRAQMAFDSVIGVMQGPLTKAFENLQKVISSFAKWVATIVDKVTGSHLADLFKTPEEVVADLKTTATELKQTNQKIADLKKASENPEEYKKELQQKKILAEKSYVDQATHTEDLNDQYKKAKTAAEKIELEKQLTESRKLEKEKKQESDNLSLEIRNQRQNQNKEIVESKLMELEKQKLALEEKKGSLETRAGTLESAPGTSKEFYNKMYETLLEEAKKAKVANPEAIARLGASQSSLETGYGKSTAGGNNYFGIKAKAGDTNASMVDTEEYDPKLGKMVKQKAGFRKYGSMEESAADYIKFLQENQRYKGVLGAKSAEEAIAEQAKTGYATDPDYASKLSKINARGEMKQGRDGGMFSGSESGYPVMLHGTEIVIPMPDTKSLDVQKTALSEMSSISNSTQNLTENSTVDNMKVMYDMIDMLSAKLDSVVDHLATGNDYTDQLLKYSRV